MPQIKVKRPATPPKKIPKSARTTALALQDDRSTVNPKIAVPPPIVPPTFAVLLSAAADASSAIFISCDHKKAPTSGAENKGNLSTIMNCPVIFIDVIIEIKLFFNLFFSILVAALLGTQSTDTSAV